MNEPKLISKIKTKSVSESVQYIKRKLNDDLDLFLPEFEFYLKDLSSTTFASLLFFDEHLSKIIYFAEIEEVIESITYYFDSSELAYFSLFMRDVGNHKIAINSYLNDDSLIYHKDKTKVIVFNRHIFEIDNGEFMNRMLFSINTHVDDKIEQLIHYTRVYNHLINQLSEPETDILDLSDAKGTEKIIYLHKIGVIDFLRNKPPFTISTNQLATYLSAITGEKPSTIQSYINPLINDGTNQKNNPLNRVKTVEKIEQSLINMGFNIDDFTT